MRDSTVENTFHSTAAVASDSAEAPSPPGPSVFSEVRSRLTWATSILFATLALGSTVGAATLVIGAPSSLASRKSLVLFVPFIPILLYRVIYEGKPWSFNSSIIEPTVYVDTDAKYFVAAVEALAYSALVALAVAVGCILFRAVLWQLAAGSSRWSRVSVLSRYYEQVRVLLYIGAAALVAGTLEVSALYAWATALLTRDSVYLPAASEIPEAMGLLTGSFYSILLAAVFLPAFAFLRWQAERIAGRVFPHATEVARREWLTQNGLVVSVPKQIGSLLAVLAPLVAGGPLTHLLGLAGH